MTGAIHGLEGKEPLFAFGDEHILLVLCPVAGALPQGTGHDKGRVHLHIAVLADFFPHVVPDDGVDHPAVGMPENLSRIVLVDVEEIHLTAQLAVVTALSLRQHIQVCLQVGGLFPGSAVDAGQHGPLHVAPPVGSRSLHQLEGLGVDLLGAAHMGATAQVRKVTLIVDGDGGILWQPVNELQLVGLIGEHSPCLLPRKLLALEFLVAGKNLPHLLFDYRQILLGDGAGQLKIIVKAVLDGRPDGHLGAGKQLQYRLRHNVGGTVADGGQPLPLLNSHIFLHDRHNHPFSKSYFYRRYMP